MREILSWRRDKRNPQGSGDSSTAFRFIPVAATPAGGKLLLITDAWHPQVNGVVTAFEHMKLELEKRGFEVVVVHPALFKNLPLPFYPEIRLALLPRRSISRALEREQPDFIHIATEGPLGLAEASETESAALAFSATPTFAAASTLLEAISKEAGVRTHRPAVLRGCHRMFQLCGAPDGPSPYDAAVQVREQSRLIGRPLAKRTVGSTLLLKGLEGDTAVILNPQQMDAQHLYVAMTRGARSLVICSASTTLSG